MKQLIRKILKEESLKQNLLDQIKQDGVYETSKLVGGIDNLFKILDIKSPMDFLHLFDDLKITNLDRLSLLRFIDGSNQQIMVYDTILNHKYLYLNERRIWDILIMYFDLYDKEIEELVKEWARNSYGLNVAKVKHQFMR